MSEPFVEIANLSLPPPLDQNNVDFLPDSYDPESWPKDLASPLSYVQQISDKIKTFSHEFREAEYSKPGFFKFHFKVTVVHPEGLLEQEYDASALKYFTSKRHAQQAAAYMFVLNPPEWIAIILRGKKPDYQTYCNDGQKKNENDTYEEEINLEKPVSSDSNIFTQIEHFTHEEFHKELSQFPEKFCDMHEDGHIIVKTLKEGNMYPETNAPLIIDLCVKKQDNTIIEQALSLEIRPSEAMPYLFWILSNMKIGEEVLGYTTHHNAYGLLGLHSVVTPNESLLCYVKIISALPYTMLSDEIEDIKETSVMKRIEQATQCNISGKIFYERKLFKLALDQFETGTRRLKLDSKLKELISEELLQRHTNIMCLLRSNIAAVYANNLFFPLPSPKSLTLSSDALFVQHKIMYNCKGCLKLIPENPKVLYRYSRALLYLQEFEKSKKYREKARDYVNANPEKYQGLKRQFEIESRVAKERESLYTQKSTELEKKMGSVFAQSKGDISVKSKSKRAVTPEVARENIKSQSPIKMQFSEEELSMKRKIKEDIFDNFEEDIGILPEKTVSEVDSEGNIVNEKISEPAFSQREVFPKTKIDLERPLEPFVDEKGRVIEGFASTGYDGSESDTEEEEESKGPKITFFGDPYEFMQDFIRFSPAGENQGNREGFEF